MIGGPTDVDADRLCHDQAIACVNRPYEDTDGLVKSAGFVLDFVGIFENLEKALAFDSDDVTSVIRNLDVLNNNFAKRICEDAAAYLPFTTGWDDKAKERAIGHGYFTADGSERYIRYRQGPELTKGVASDSCK